MKRIIFIPLVAALLYGCADKAVTEKVATETQDQMLLSVLWFQKSPEMKAMFYQSYNTAERSLTEKLQKQTSELPKAVVMDIDETILDNSPFEAYQIINNLPYNDSIWTLWTDKAVAEPLPGALEFTLFAEKQGVEIFYVTNRSGETAFNSTIANLKEKGFPFADSVHLVTKSTTSSKEERRKKIASDHEILLFIGDNMGDFDIVFDDRTADLGFGAVNQNIDRFGDRYIILPNPMYGPWINAAINQNEGETQREKILKSLKSF